MAAQRRPLVTLRSRKPISDEVVYASSIPFRRLTEWKKEGLLEICEATDPWGNLALIHKGPDLTPFFIKVLSKEDFIRLNDFHSDIVNDIQGDVNRFYQVNDTYVRNFDPLDGGYGSSKFIKTEIWTPVCNGFQLSGTEGRVESKADMLIPLTGPREELIDDHFSGEIVYERSPREGLVRAHIVAECYDNTPMEYFFERVWSDPARVYPVFDPEGIWTPIRGGYYSDGWRVKKKRDEYCLRRPDGWWKSFPSLRKAGEYVGLTMNFNRGRKRK